MMKQKKFIVFLSIVLFFSCENFISSGMTSLDSADNDLAVVENVLKNHSDKIEFKFKGDTSVLETDINGYDVFLI